MAAQPPYIGGSPGTSEAALRHSEERFRLLVDGVRRSAQVLRYTGNDLRLEDEASHAFPDLMASLLTRYRAMARRAHQITLELGDDVPSAPLGEIGTQLFRILQEALTNARRRSGAEKVSVIVSMDGGTLVAEVIDVGRGFGVDTAAGVGQSSMRERAQIIGGELQIGSKPGRGTRVSLRVPLPPLDYERGGARR
jgi:signal transduction histidine kinase